jgi:phosphatidate phosphatase APP1
MGSLRKAIARTFGLESGPFVKVYDGYGDKDDIIVHGHVLATAPAPVEQYKDSMVANTMQLLRLFMVRPMPDRRVRVNWMGQQHEAVCDENGFFKVEWVPEKAVPPGWHPVTVDLLSENGSVTGITGSARIYTPHGNQYAVVSDIDDTFLISHSANLRKRLYVLFTENAETRQPFEDVVAHYQALSRGTGDEEPNPFFYVSSSEWNLYDYIRTFCAKHGLPDGILLLSPLKRLSDVWRTGQGRHSIKFVRIARILKSHPHHRYILLGDDTQQDPEIYASLVEHFPEKIFAVYIRQVKEAHRDRTGQLIREMEASGVQCCYFEHSRDAMEHSRRSGLVR